MYPTFQEERPWKKFKYELLVQKITTSHFRLSEDAVPSRLHLCPHSKRSRAVEEGESEMKVRDRELSGIFKNKYFIQILTFKVVVNLDEKKKHLWDLTYLEIVCPRATC